MRQLLQRTARATYPLRSKRARVSRTGRQNQGADRAVLRDAFRKPDGALLRFSRSGKEVRLRDRSTAAPATWVPRTPRLRWANTKVIRGWSTTAGADLVHIPTRDGTRLAWNLSVHPRGQATTERHAGHLDREPLSAGRVYEGAYTILDNYPGWEDWFATASGRGRGRARRRGILRTSAGCSTSRDPGLLRRHTEGLGTQPWSNAGGDVRRLVPGVHPVHGRGPGPAHLAAIVPEKAGADL